MDTKRFEKSNGDVFFEARRAPDNSFLFANWIGIQTLETMVMGNNYILKLLRERACQSFLNSNREVIGPWDVAVNWLAYKWVPQARELGLAHYAHVLSPGIYGQRSFKKFSEAVQAIIQIKAFEDEGAAKEWLRYKVRLTSTR